MNLSYATFKTKCKFGQKVKTAFQLCLCSSHHPTLTSLAPNLPLPSSSPYPLSPTFYPQLVYFSSFLAISGQKGQETSLLSCRFFWEQVERSYFFLLNKKRGLTIVVSTISACNNHNLKVNTAYPWFMDYISCCEINN